MAKNFSIGATVKLAGDITTLNAIWAGSDEAIEEQLGFQSGRLSLGYTIALVCEPLKPADFQFSGTTLRSGGRYGLPKKTLEADALRRRVHDSILEERGAEGYRQLQDATLRDIVLHGPKRLAKVLPVIRHDADLPPATQYPMGGGALQWKLIRQLKFLIAARITQDGQAITPDFTVDLRRSGGYDVWYNARRRLRHYMETA